MERAKDQGEEGTEVVAIRIMPEEAVEGAAVKEQHQQQ